MNTYIETDIKEVKEQLVWNHAHGHKTIVLLGSGMSVSAGIPASEGIMERIRHDFSSVCARTHPVTYEDHLAILTQPQRQELIREFVSGAKLNAAHLFFATLVKEGFVDKVITSNFDTLLHRALALENIYPNIFDFTSSQNPDSADFSNISLFHMHGQKDGMLYLKDESSYDNYLDKMRRFFGDSFEKQTIIVVGYSGSDDPLFGFLASVRAFENRLYWVGHNDKEPDEHVFRGILQQTRKQACYIKGYDADTFFIQLSELLGLKQPRIISDPLGLVQEVRGLISFNHLASDHLVVPEISFPTLNLNEDPKNQPEIETDEPAEEKLVVTEDNASNLIENDEPEELLATEPLLAHDEGQTNEVEVKNTEDEIEEWLATSVSAIEDKEEHKKVLSKSASQMVEESELVGLARDTWSNNIYDNYQRLQNLIAKSESEEARKYFSFFLFNWGTEIERQADEAEGEIADGLYQEAFEKYKEAISIKPDLREAYNNWGVCLRNLAKSSGGEEADRLYFEAFRKFEEAILLNPEEYEPYNNWAIGLANLAETKNEVEAEKLYYQAFEKYQEALKNKPDLVEVYNNWGVCLKNLAELKREEDAEMLYLEAFQKFKAAIKLKPDFVMSYINWGIAIRHLAKLKRTHDAPALYEEAIDKYKLALEYDPKSAHALNNWGVELGNLALLKGIKEASDLLETAFHKYELALQYKPDFYEALNNWGIDLWNLGNLKSGQAAENLYNQAFKKFEQALVLQPNSAEVYTNSGICQSKVAGLQEYSNSDKLFRGAFGAFKRAVELKPKLYEASYNWGISLRNYARKLEGEKSEDLYIRALKQFEKAMKKKPDRYRLYTEWDATVVNMSDLVSEGEPEKLYQSTFREYQEAIFTERSSLDLYNNYDLSLSLSANAEDIPDLDKIMSGK